MELFTKQEIQKIIESAVSGQLDEIRANMQKKIDSGKNLYLDTETTGKEAKDRPVTIGLYKQGGQKKNYYLDYGNIDKTANYLVEAMMAKDEGGKELDSAKELQQNFGVSSEAFKSTRKTMEKAKKEMADAFKEAVVKKFQDKKWVEENVIGPQKLTEMLQDEPLVGFNINFDIDMLRRYYKSQKAKLPKSLTIKNGKYVGNIRDVRTQMDSHLGNIGGNLGFLGHKQLQNYVQMAQGSIDSHAHDAAADAKATAMIDGNEGMKQALKIVSEQALQIAKIKNIPVTKNDGAYTGEFKALFGEVMDAMTQVIHDPNSGGVNNNNGNNATKSSSALKEAMVSEARKQVGKFYREKLGNGTNQQTTAQKALTGKHLTDRLKTLGVNAGAMTTSRFGMGIDKDTTPLARQSAAYYLEEIINKAESNGWGVVLNTQGENISIGLYDKSLEVEGQAIDPKNIAKIEIGVVGEDGVISLGNKKSYNLLTPVVDFAPQKDGTTKATPVMSSLMEAQLESVYRILDSDRMKTKMAKGDIEGVESLMSFVRNESLKTAPSGLSRSITDEMEITMGDKTPEQMAELSGRGSILRLAKQLYSNSKFQAQANLIYGELAEKKWGNSKYGRKVDPNELTQEEITAVNAAFAMMTNGWLEDENDPKIASMEDSFLKRILSNKETFELIRRDFGALIQNGMAFDVSPLREEQFIGGMFQMPVGEIGFGDSLVDPSNRAPSQKYNYRNKANAPKFASKNYLGAEAGRKQGIDYSDLRDFGQYTGAYVNDEKIYEALKTLGANEELLASVLQGGIIMPDSMRKELATYREVTSEEFNPLLGTVKELLDELGVSKKIASANVGDVIPVSEYAGLRDSQTINGIKDFNLSERSVIQGIEKTADGIKIVAQLYEEAKEGSKILTGTNGRKTARFLSDDMYAKLTKELGVEDAKYLTEKEGLTTKHLMDSFRGRISYIIGEAIKNNKSLDEVEQVMKSMPVIGKAIQRVGDTFEFTGYYDNIAQDYMYTAKDGSVHELFGKVDKNGKSIKVSEDEKKRLINQALVEGADSAISSLGIGLLGGQHYQDTKEYVSASLNIANLTPYFEPTGGGTANTVEKRKGVRATDRERQAFATMMDRYTSVVGNKQGLALYSKSEQAIQNRYGAQGKRAQRDLEKLRNAYNNRTVSNPDSDQVIELVWANGGPLKPNQIDLSQIKTKVEYGNDGAKGVAEKDFEGTIGQQIKELREKGYKDSQVILNLESAMQGSDLLGMSDNANKYIPLASIASTRLSDGSFMPSITDRAVTRLVQRVNEAIDDEVELDLSDTAKALYEDYQEAMTDKDGELVRKATSSYLPNATHAKVVGQNIAEVVERAKRVGDSAYNTVFANEDYVRKMLGTQKRPDGKKSAKDYARNIQSLSRLYRSGGKYANEALANEFAKYDNVNHWEKDTIKNLQQTERDLIQAIISQMYQGRTLVTQAHRYPSTSGLDWHGAFLGLNNRVDEGTVSVGRGLALMYNADYDGDTNQFRLANMGSSFKTFEAFNSAYQAATEVSEIEAKVAKHMAKWEEAKTKSGEKTKDEEAEALVEQVSKSNEAQFAGVMSKFNKGYVGRFSNLSTNMRNSKELIGFGKLGDNATEDDRVLAIYSSIINAFTESLEQDAISAKKVAARLIANGDTVGLNELTGLEDLVRNGDVYQAIDKAVSLGIIKTDDYGKIDTRQFEFARAVAENTDQEIFSKLGLEKGITVETVKSAFKALQEYAENNGHLTFQELFSKDKVAEKVEKGVVKPTKTPETKLNAGNTSGASGSSNPYKALKVKNIPGTEHSREWSDRSGSGKVSVEGKSITEILSSGEPELQPWEKERLEKSAAKGTYAHKVAELLTKEGKESIGELSPEGQQEIETAKAELNKKLGSLTSDVVDSLNRRGEQAVAFAREAGILNGDLETEVLFGGALDGVGNIGGQADLITWGENGVSINDWKFSNKGGKGDNLTIAERIAQTSAYFALLEEELKAQESELMGADGKAKAGKESELEVVQKKLELLSKNRTINIVRSFEKDGQIYNEIMSAPAVNKEAIWNLLQNASNNKFVDYTGLDLSQVNFSTSRDNSSGSQTQENALKGRILDVEGPNALEAMIKNASQAAQEYESINENIHTKIKSHTDLLNKQVKSIENMAEATAKIEALEKEIKRLEDLKDSNNQELIGKYKEQKKIQEEKLKLAQQEYETSRQARGRLGLEETIKNGQVDEDDVARIRQIEDSAVNSSITAMMSSGYRVDAENEIQGIKKQDKLVTQYTRELEKQYKLERDIEKTRRGMEGKTGTELRDAKNLLSAYESQLAQLKGNALVYDANKGTLGGIELTQENINRLESEQKRILANHETQLANINSRMREEKSLISEIVGGFKASFRNLTDYTLAYEVIGLMKQSVNQVIASTKELDSALVDIQIASGMTRNEVHDLQKQYADLADELGRTTAEVSTASNDWLRAGYEGKEATELTSASMHLSTLGMIEASDATSYLISVLKGWKIEASEVMSVVDKLSVNYYKCGVCLVISIGHKSKCG